MKNDFCLVIPARLNSKRLPKKVLLKINNKTILEHVYEKCLKVVHEKNIYVATPDKKIKELCIKKNINCILTPSSCKTGTDRVAELAKKIKKKYYINVQADEIFFDPININRILNEIRNNKYDVINLYKKILNSSEFYSRTVPKVIFNNSKELLYMSRAPIPSNKSGIFFKSFKQICIYAFTKKALNIFYNKKNKTFFESIEDIEILRFLELGVKIRMMEGKGSQLAIDTLFDFKAAKKILEK